MVLPRMPVAATPQRSLPYGEVANTVAAVKRSRATRVLKLAFEFLVLTAARGGEARGTWEELDCRSQAWILPPTG